MPERLGDLTEAQSVNVYCGKCDHHAQLDLIELLKLYGTRCKISRIRVKLFCRKRGSHSIEWRWGHSGQPQARRLVDVLWASKGA